MKILVTGANGYIGQRLVLALLTQGHQVYCLVRDPGRFDKTRFTKFDGSFYLPNESCQAKAIDEDDIFLVKGDLLNLSSIEKIPPDLDLAYYLVHSMSSQNRKDFEEMEEICARNFIELTKQTQIKQTIYLSGISNDQNLSKHLRSRHHVEEILRQGNFHLTVLRAAIIIGSGSASFEIIRDLVEKLPVMVAPQWLHTKCQPIAIRNVIQYLVGVIMQAKAFDRVFDIGGPDVLTYKEMLEIYAKVRKLKRMIITVPVMTPRLSSYWLHFVTSTNYTLARTLVSSLKNEVVCKNLGIEEIVPIQPLSYSQALNKTLYRIAHDEVPSSWRDAFNLKASKQTKSFDQTIIPEYGILYDLRRIQIICGVEQVKENVWTIGGKQGWYSMDWAWKLRGDIDKLFGGVGLRRGRRSEKDLKVGDALDFWRVQYADYQNGHLILHAEMKIPGEAWLEFQIEEKNGQNFLIQRAVFYPQGLFGRLYWYALVPMHHFIFEGMARKIAGHVK